MGDGSVSDLELNIRGFKWPTLNSFYAGMHWSKRKRIVDQWHTIVWVELLRQHGSDRPSFNTPVTITVTGYGTRPPDPDGMAAAAKLVIDGLCIAGVLQDDTYLHVDEVRLRSRKADKKHPSGLVIQVAA
jgi:hypothetical protein